MKLDQLLVFCDKQFILAQFILHCSNKNHEKLSKEAILKHIKASIENRILHANTYIAQTDMLESFRAQIEVLIELGCLFRDKNRDFDEKMGKHVNKNFHFRFWTPLPVQNGYVAVKPD